MPPRIKVENLSKCYQIGQRFERSNEAKYRMLRDVLVEAIKAPIRNLRSGAALGRTEEFWSLRDISFEVNDGDTLAIVGANGAGKSTLLKILTQITTPTNGRADLRGRVGSLLEVGTGFHPELTGRENIFLNGSILGMSRTEIRSRFDEIVDFAGLGKFIETPVKRYSSGMKVRLGFAVAAHLDLEILLVDEVLAVGDAEFQRKCLGKMDQVAQSGRTVLFVSHNMAAVENLCSRALLLEKGRLTLNASSSEVVSRYLTGLGTQTGTRDLTDPSVDRGGAGNVRFESMALKGLGGNSYAKYGMGEGMQIEASLVANKDLQGVFLTFAVTDARGDLITILHGSDQGDVRFDLMAGDRRIVTCRVPQMNLHPDMYAITAEIRSSYALQPQDHVERAVDFEVAPTDVFGTGKYPKKAQKIFLQSEWSVANSQ